MKQNTENSKSQNGQNVQAQPPVVAVLTPQISEENPPATAGCAAASSSASGNVISRELRVVQQGVEFGYLQHEIPLCGASFQRGYKCAEYLIKSAIKEGVDITNLEVDWCIVPRPVYQQTQQ